MHKEVKMFNETAALTLDLYGGAISAFQLNEYPVNPLSFKLPVENMPRNNRNGAPYQGHFLCLGRWGQPSEGEIKAGIPNHGQPANMLWKTQNESTDQVIMEVTSALEGLQVRRAIQMEPKSAAYAVKERVTNINPLGRLYNIVQHPTLAAPFLNEDTVINCNAQMGFNNVFSKKPEQHCCNWPNGICEDGRKINLSKPKRTYNSVFSFIVNRTDKYGWVTAYSPTHQLLLGYIWLRKDYPWINLWQDWSGKQIRYRGIEFGTTGIHQPFQQIIADQNMEVFGEQTCRFLDAGAEISNGYISFIQYVGADFEGVECVSVESEEISISAGSVDFRINISTIIKSFNGF